MWNENAAMAQTPSAPANGGYGKATVGGQTMPLDELAKKLESMRERTSFAAQRVRTIADGLFGPQPSPGDSQGNTLKPSPSSRMTGLNDGADSVLYWLNELDGQLSRLNPLG